MSNKSRTGALAVILGLAVGYGTWGHAADPAALRYQFTENQVVSFESEHVSEFTTQAGQTVEKVTNSTRSWKQFRVVSVDSSGGAVLEPVLTRVQMQNQFNELDPVQWDSQTGDPPPQFSQVAASLNRAVARFHVKATGALVKIEPIAADVPGLPEAAKRTDASMNFLVAFPEEPVAIGGSWKERFEVPVTLDNGLVQQVTVQRQYELVEMTDGIAKIRVRAVVLSPISDPKIELQLIQRTPAGEIQFDTTRGLLVSQSSKIDKTVLGAIGPDSRITALGTVTEKLVDAAQSASAPRLLNAPNRK